MKDAADDYAQRATETFCSRADITDVQRELLHAMLALAWQSGYAEGGKTMAELVKREWDIAMKGVIK